ncbi:MAG TPA: hypothetical protein VGA67_01035 [Candidatus Dojkabacteria bacterium]|jgi:hypothetical protein
MSDVIALQQIEVRINEPKTPKPFRSYLLAAAGIFLVFVSSACAEKTPTIAPTIIPPTRPALTMPEVDPIDSETDCEDARLLVRIAESTPRTVPERTLLNLGFSSGYNAAKAHFLGCAAEGNPVTDDALLAAQVAINNNPDICDQLPIDNPDSLISFFTTTETDMELMEPEDVYRRGFDNGIALAILKKNECIEAQIFDQINALFD